MQQMPEWLVVIILGIIEGITEFLPISSTGHMLLAEHWLPHKQGELFLALVQGGAVLAVVLVFKDRLMQFATKWREPETQAYLAKLAAAFALTAVGGLLLKHYHFKLEKNVHPIAWATLIGGILFVVAEVVLKGKKLSNEVTWTVAIAIGVGQLIAVVFPGASRSGSTILMALALGLARPAAAEFSFLLGIPTLLAAGAKETLDALKHGETVNWSMIALGSFVAAVVAFAVVKWLLKYVQNHTFTLFGWYRIVVGAVILIFVKG